jgi:hypothetical protein
VGQIAHLRLSVDAFEMGKIAALAHQHEQLCALGGQGSRHMVTDKSCCACKKYSHGQIACKGLS